ncbi:MAG TPA: NAD(P)-binding domain-containing protein [Pseudolabrys sp.]|jgi:ornithine cyclodeaminase/alanine dehydrogenase-like protein (mu-crystallin family)
MRLLSEQDVERLIDPSAAIEAVAGGYVRHATGHMPEPGRLDVRRHEPEGNVLVLAGHSDDQLFATKLNTHAYPDPLSRQRRAASMMLLWDAVECRPLAMIATTAFNNHRTAAGLAAAARRLAPPQARTLAVFGAGKIAPAVIRYLSAVRLFERILIVGHGPTRAGELAAAVGRWPGFEDRLVKAESDPAEAARQADVIVTITTAKTPVFPGAAAKSGSLVILAGANRPDAREADDVLIGRAQIYVDHEMGCMTRAGDLAIPLASGHLPREHIAGEIGHAISGRLAPALPATDVTVFKSIGIIAQDIALGELILRRAKQDGVGTEFDPQDGTCQMAAPERAPGPSAITAPARVALS